MKKVIALTLLACSGLQAFQNGQQVRISRIYKNSNGGQSTEQMTRDVSFAAPDDADSSADPDNMKVFWTVQPGYRAGWSFKTGGSWLSADKDGKRRLVVKDNKKEWEDFNVIPYGEGYVLQALSNGKYITAAGEWTARGAWNDGIFLYANEPNIQNAQQFRIDGR